MGDRSVHQRAPFSLDTDSRRTFIWREPGTRYLPSNVREIDNYDGGGVMVWGGIMLDGRTSLHVFDRGSVTGVRYRDEVLEPYVRLFRGAVSTEFILMDDNASHIEIFWSTNFSRVRIYAGWIGRPGLQTSTL